MAKGVNLGKRRAIKVAKKLVLDAWHEGMARLIFMVETASLAFKSTYLPCLRR